MSLVLYRLEQYHNYEISFTIKSLKSLTFICKGFFLPLESKIISMKSIFKILVFVSLFTSCDILKESTKNKRNTDFEQYTESSRKRKGDTVAFVPIVNFKYKDTTIYTVNREGTTLRTVYKDGVLSSSECMASAIEENTKALLKLQESEKDKTQKKEENFDSSFVLYIVIGLIVIVCFGMFLMFKTINKNSAAITEIMKKFS